MNSTNLDHQLIIPVLLAVIALLLYLYATRKFNYWRSKGVPYLKPLPFIGNLKEVVTFQRCLAIHLQHIYERVQDQPYKGFFMFDQPVLMIKDLDLLKTILQKDFHHFEDKGITLTKVDKLLGDALFCLKGKIWKSTRAKISPGFSTSKLKNIHDIVNEKIKLLIDYCEQITEKGYPVPAKDLFGRYTTDIFASVGFGIECNSLKNPNEDFRENLKYSFLYSKLGALKLVGVFVDLPLYKLYPVSTAPTQVVKFFQKSVWNAVKLRLSAPDRTVRNDYLDILMHAAKVHEIPMEHVESSCDLDIVSQAFTFLAAGFETTTSTILSTMYHLALDHNIQNKLRNEIQEALDINDGELSYDIIRTLPYLDMVISETLRLYPTMSFIDRTCTIPYKIPGTDIIIDKGEHVYTSLLGIHKNPEIYPDPECYDPERFSEENKKNRHKFAYMPFGEGPRICIGKRLGLMIVKNTVSHMLLNYEVLPCEDTPKKLAFNVHSFLLTTSHEVPLIFKKLNYYK